MISSVVNKCFFTWNCQSISPRHQWSSTDAMHFRQSYDPKQLKCKSSMEKIQIKKKLKTCYLGFITRSILTEILIASHDNMKSCTLFILSLIWSAEFYLDIDIIEWENLLHPQHLLLLCCCSCRKSWTLISPFPKDIE